MDYKIQDLEKTFDGKIVENLGNNDYVIKIDDKEHTLKIVSMNSKGIEFILDNKYHKAKYLEQSTNEMNIVIDNVPITLNLHTHFDEVVYKNSGGGGTGNAQLGLKSQIPGKVVSKTIKIKETATVAKGDVVAEIE
jgi:biotin carboxyl carrier protein